MPTPLPESLKFCTVPRRGYEELLARYIDDPNEVVLEAVDTSEEALAAGRAYVKSKNYAIEEDFVWFSEIEHDPMTEINTTGLDDDAYFEVSEANRPFTVGWGIIF